MATGFGHSSWIGFGVESTYGTAVTAAQHLEILEESIKGAHSKLSLPSLRRVSQEHVVSSKKTVEGSFKIQFPWEGAETLLKHAMGSVGTTGSGPYVHAFALEDDLPVGLTLEVNRDSARVGAGTSWKYEGCQVSRMTLTQEMEQFLEAEFELLGEDWGNITASSLTFPTFVGVDWTMLSTMTIGANTHKMESISLTLDNSLATERYQLGSRTRIGLGRSGPRKITGSCTFELESSSSYAFYAALTDADITFTWTSATRILSINLPKCYLTAGEPVVSDAGPIKVTAEFEAFMNSAENDEMTLSLTNNTVSVT